VLLYPHPATDVRSVSTHKLKRAAAHICTRRFGGAGIAKISGECKISYARGDNK